MLFQTSQGQKGVDSSVLGSTLGELWKRYKAQNSTSSFLVYFARTSGREGQGGFTNVLVSIAETTLRFFSNRRHTLRQMPLVVLSLRNPQYDHKK